MTIHSEKRGAVAWVTFDRPEARNAFTHEMYALLGEICAALGADDDVRVVVFQGKGDDAFVSGSDIRRVGEIRGAADALAYEKHIEQGIGGVEKLPKATIALIRGVAAGGGAAIALACTCGSRRRTRDSAFPSLGPSGTRYPCETSRGWCRSSDRR